jgi:tetratricopeptide (TPR) repeat protein/transcriptional regulator with XRE-family HTH domain
VGEQSALSFAALLRQIRADAGLTQEELAYEATLSPRSISDLERGINRTTRKQTARLLADALALTGPERELFEAAASGQATAVETLAATRRAAGVTAVRTLPRDIASFTGRTGELRQLTTAVASVASRGGVVSIHAIGGMAGVGKTALAVHAAHQLAGDYPDGQFFLPLHGHTPGQQPVPPADALATLLLTAGLRASHIPADLDARAALWRDHAAGRKILLLLDDATGHEQVRPLLPGTAGSLVLITSRRRLAALEDAVPLSLDTLPPDDATAVLVRLAGRPDLGPGPASQLTRLCGYLPLAIGLVGRQLAHHPAWTATDLTAELAAARDRLEPMRAENVSVAAAFDLSYRDLGAAQQRLFRRLGVHPGPDFDAHAAAALDGTSLSKARRHLDDLYDQHLLNQPGRGRYRFHDLIREHARALAADEPADGAATTGRLLDYYLHTTLAASRHVAVRLRGARRAPPLARPPACAPRLASAEQATAWLAAERGNLQAATDYAADGYHQHASQIPAAISSFLYAGGFWDQAIGLHQTALAAARRAGDPHGQADALNHLCVFQTLTGDVPAGAANQRQALALYRELGDRLGQGDALHTQGFVQAMMDDFPAAAASFGQALTRYREAGDRIGQGDALLDLGDAQMLAGNYAAAGASLRQALDLFRELGDRYGQAVTLGGLGGLQIQAGEYPAAVTSLRQALELYRDLGDRDGEAHAIAGLGEVQRLTGDYPAAAASLRRAQKIFGEVGDRANYAAGLGGIGIVYRLTGDYAAAADCLGQALSLARDLDDRLNQAEWLGQLGQLRVLTGDHAAAADCLGQALEIARALGVRFIEASVLNTLGELRLRCAAGREAAENHRAALAIACDLGAPVEEARAREGLGRCRIQAGDHGEGVAQLRQALAIYQRLGDPAATGVRQALHDHGSQAATPARAGSRAISRSTSSPG